MYGPGPHAHKALVHELGRQSPEVIPELPTDVDALWIHSGGKEVAAWLDCWLGSWRRRTAGRDRSGTSTTAGSARCSVPSARSRTCSTGRWLGHPLHAATTDVPIGSLVVAVVLDLLGPAVGGDVALLATVLFMLAAAASGAADYADTDGTARVRASLHSTLMVVGLVVLVVSLVLRAGGPADRTVPIALSIVGLLIVTAGAYVGGDVVYLLGNMVSRHAFRGAGGKWIRLDTGDLTDLSLLPDATPTKAKAGINDLVLVRLGSTVHALHAVCAHAGGPLQDGQVVDGCIECPWHGSRFRLEDGRLARGPAVYDQPAYEIRAAEAGGYEVRRIAR